MAQKPKSQKQPPLQSPKGMHDRLPEDQYIWEKIRRTAEDIGDYYNFQRIDTPILEQAELFERTVGEATDIVEKQMFTLTTKGKERLVLRPENTAAIARAFVQHSLSQRGLPLKLFYEGPFFRYEQPQAGRLREFHQIGFEILSMEDDPIYDTQVILVLFRLLETLKLKGFTVSINSIGCKNCRPLYRKELQAYYRPLKGELCADCVRRLDTNPLRLLDCKEEKCRTLKDEAPIIIDHLCTHCHAHFKSVLEYLEELKISYTLNHHLVRGLDYYTKTVFEITSESLPFSIAGGGRYDYLIELLGGRPTPAVGWAGGIERIIEAMKLQGISTAPKAKPKVFFIYIGDLAKKRSLGIIEELRRHHIDVAESLGRESLRAQLHNADKLASPLALIFGQKEAFEESIIVRDLTNGAQETIPLAKMIETIKKRFLS
ncbi:MAG: histidine--tRNA ligase [Patescibacteria group bacterium]